MAIVLNTGRRDSSPCDARVGIFSSDVQLYYLMMDRILITSCVASKMVSRNVDLTFLAFSLNVTVALSGLSPRLLSTLCRRLIRHFKTYTSCLFPCEPRASPAESKKLASLDGTFTLGLSKMAFGGIDLYAKRWVTHMNVPSPIVFALDATLATWGPPRPSDLGGTFHIHRLCLFTSITNFSFLDTAGIFGL